jgi:hypothetical protein
MVIAREKVILKSDINFVKKGPIALPESAKKTIMVIIISLP